MNVSTLTALIEARRLIHNGWNQKTFARDSRGHMCDWGSELARSFCSIGAIYKATDWRNTQDTSLCMDVMNIVAEQMPLGYNSVPAEHIARYNDRHTKEEVLDAFDRSIAAQMKVESVIESKELVGEDL
jgi:hypothetical protein